MNTLNKEQVYDEQISPLMAQIIAIAKEHKIDFLASFALPTAADAALRCTTAILASDAPRELLHAFRLIRDGFTSFAITTRQAQRP